MKKFLLGPALAALAMFMWGFIYWGTPHHLPYRALNAVPDQGETAAAIGKLLPASGAYLLPNPTLGEEKMQALSSRGPMVEVHITKEGFGSADMGKTMAVGYAHAFTIAVVLSVILCAMSKVFVAWTCRVKFSALLGLLVGVCDLGRAVWWHHGLGWTLGQAFYDFTMFVIAGLVLAKF
ncbi:MAG: hypothetical protein RLZZ15_3436, partial [Verrucomicrobiota bacterium]